MDQISFFGDLNDMLHTTIATHTNFFMDFLQQPLIFLHIISNLFWIFNDPHMLRLQITPSMFKTSKPIYNKKNILEVS